MRVIVVLSVVIAAALASTSPFLAWSSTAKVFPTSTVYGSAVNADNLTPLLDSLVAQEGVIVVFQQDSLTIQDFTQYGNVYSNPSGGSFYNIKGLLNGSPSSLVVPHVARAAIGQADRVIAHLKKAVLAQGGAVVVAAEGVLAVEDFKSGVANLVIVQLPEPSGDVAAAYTANDALIGTIMNKANVMNSAISGVVVGNSAASPVLAAAAPQTKNIKMVKVRRAPVAAGVAPTPFPTPLPVNDVWEFLYFTPPIFMGVLTGLLIVVVGLVGVYELMAVQTSDRYASTTDKCLTVPAN